MRHPWFISQQPKNNYALVENDMKLNTAEPIHFVDELIVEQLFTLGYDNDAIRVALHSEGYYLLPIDDSLL